VICKHCALSADHFSDVNTEMVVTDWEKVRKEVNLYHKHCIGCDCQHKLPGTGIKKDIKNAQRPTE
jgi:hypothetical protein